MSPRGDKRPTMTRPELAEAVEVIRRAEKARLMSWASVADIQRRRGYLLDGYANINAFCIATFQWDRRHASRIILAYHYVKQHPELHHLSERHIRSLRLAGVTQQDAIRVLAVEPEPPSVRELENLISKFQGWRTWGELEKLARHLDLSTKAQVGEHFWIEAARHQDFLPQLQAGSIDYVITDIAYRVGDLSQVQDFAKGVKRVLRPNGVVAVMVGMESMLKAAAMIDEEIPYRGEIVYQLPSRRCSRVYSKRVDPTHKSVLIFGQGHPHDWIGGTVVHAGSVEAGIKNIHPDAQSVVGFQRLIEKLVRRTPDVPHPIVLDPYLGSGSTAIACLRHGGIKFIGCDCEPRYAEFAKTRLFAEWATVNRL